MKVGSNKRPGSPGLAPDENKASNQDEMNAQSLFNPEQNIEFQKNVEQPANPEQIQPQSTLFHHPSLASDTTTLQPNQVQDMSWEQIVVEFKKSGKLCNAKNQVLYTSDIPKDLLKLIINPNVRSSDIHYGGTRGIPDLIKTYGEGVFIAYLWALKQRKRYIIKLVKKCFELALDKLQEKTDRVKIEFLKIVVTMIGELNLPNDHIVSIKDTYNKKNITVDGYDFCKEIDKLKLAKTLIMDSFIAFEGNDYTKILQCACYYFRTRNDTQGIPLDKVIENAGAIAKAFSEITYDEEDTNISLKIGDINLYSKQEGEPNYQLLKDIFTFLKKGDKESSVNIVKFIQLNQKIYSFSTLFGKVMLNYGIIANQNKWNELAYGRSEFEAEKSPEPNFNDLEGYLDELPDPNDF